MSDEIDTNESEGIASLRKAHDKLKSELDSALKELGTYRAEKRSQTVGEYLKAKGVNPAAAKFYTGDDTSEDAVGKWLEENKDLFPASSPSTTTSADPNLLSVQRVAEASFGTVNSMQNGTDAARVLGDPEALAHAIRTLPYDELVKQGYMPPNGQLFTPPAR